MRKNNQVYEAIRELICLVCYASNNLECGSGSLGVYEFNGKVYELYLYNGFHPSIFIKCENDTLFLMIENHSYIEYFNGPIKNDVILHVNNYKNIDMNDIRISFDLVSKNNIVNELKIKLDDSYYQFSSDLYCNENRTCQETFEENRYTFEEPEIFDEFLMRKNFLPKIDAVFSPEIILNLVQMVYVNFKDIYINSKIDGIIRSLSQEELVILKEKLQEQDIKSSQKLVRTKNVL